MGKWSDLPADLLYAIEDHLVLYIDKIRIRSVSLDWNSYLSKLPDHRRTPFLLHPIEYDEEATHGLFNPLDNKIYKIYLPEACVKIFKGSSYGWIITVEDFHSTTHTDVCLINPVTRDQIKLPPRTEFPDVIRYSPDNVGEEYTIRSFLDIDSYDDFEEDFVDEFTFPQDSMMYAMILKVVLTRAPDHNECVAIAIYGQKGQLAWCKINDKDKRWTHIYTGGLCNIIDILYSKSRLYALCEGFEEGRVFIFENIGTELDIDFKEITTDRMPVPRLRSAYLAECSNGNLIVVVRQFFCDESRDCFLVRTKEFKVYKLSDEREHELERERKREQSRIPSRLFRVWPSISNSSWVEVKSIGDDVLFVGFGSVRAIQSSNFVGRKRNNIYFTDSDSLLGTFEDNKNEKSDVGVFNLEDGTMEPLHGMSDFIWPRPIWTDIC